MRRLGWHRIRWKFHAARAQFFSDIVNPIPCGFIIQSAAGSLVFPDNLMIQNTYVYGRSILNLEGEVAQNLPGGREVIWSGKRARLQGMRFVGGE